MLWEGKVESVTPVQLFSRDSGPKYRILLRNQTDSGDGDFTESLDDEIRFEVKEGTFFYQYDTRNRLYTHS